MPRVDGEEDELVELGLQLKIAQFEAENATRTSDVQQARQRVDQLKEQIDRLHHAGKRSVIEIDDDHPDFAHLP